VRNNHAVLRGVTTTNLKVNMFLTTNLNLLRSCPTNSALLPTGAKRKPNDTLTTPETGKVGKIAGENDGSTSFPTDGKDPAAVALGRKGGKARAEGLSARRRKEIAKKAAKARWG
jgi:hypothetical protein